MTVIFAYLIKHPEGAVLYDCGCAADSEIINAIYSPSVRSLSTALAEHGVTISEIKTVVLSHLHFDHCGQVRSLYGRPIYVQRAEVEAAQAPNYTVPEWAALPVDDRRIIEGDEDIAEGLKVIFSPGHTPGHQSLLVRGGGKTTLVGGQCCYCVEGFSPDRIEKDNLFNESWDAVAQESLTRLRSFQPDRLLLSHDLNERVEL
ncbi:MAG: N-acyl homoserine lactonase family protein [Sphingopyxis sp.]|nr:N-acyl homoserine lactonase family protein [Sphingopyxis sp.]